MMATTHAGTLPSSSASACLGRHRCATHPSQRTSHGHSRLIGNLHASVRGYGIEKEGSCPTADATSPLLVGRDRSIRNWSVHQDRSPRWVGPHGPALAPMDQEALALAPTLWNSAAWPRSKHGHEGPASIGCAGSELCKKFKNEVNEEHSAVSQETTKAVVWQPTTTLSLSRSSRDMPRHCW